MADRLIELLYENNVRCDIGIESLAEDIRSIFSDVQPVKRGYWKATMMSEGTGWDLSYTGGRDEVLEYNCSVCGKANILDEFGENFLPPYCPFCGADLREG